MSTAVYTHHRRASWEAALLTCALVSYRMYYNEKRLCSSICRLVELETSEKRKWLFWFAITPAVLSCVSKAMVDCKADYQPLDC